MKLYTYSRLWNSYAYFLIILSRSVSKSLQYSLLSIKSMQNCSNELSSPFVKNCVNSFYSPFWKWSRQTKPWCFVGLKTRLLFLEFRVMIWSFSGIKFEWFDIRVWFVLFSIICTTMWLRLLFASSFSLYSVVTWLTLSPTFTTSPSWSRRRRWPRWAFEPSHDWPLMFNWPGSILICLSYSRTFLNSDFSSFRDKEGE